MGSFWLQQLQPRGGRLDGNGSPSGTLVSPQLPGLLDPKAFPWQQDVGAVVAAEPVLGQS